jgi:beta-lactamase regulating signal transducer with metallopeptidase domain
MGSYNSIISDQILLALGWMIVHALWQIAAVGLMLWLTLQIFGKKSAAFKYRLSISALAVISVLALGTFIYSIPESNPMAPEATSLSASLDQWMQTDSGHLIEAPSDWMIVSKRIENWIPTLVQVWFLGAMLFLVRLATSLADIRNLRQKQHDPAESVWQQVLDKQLTSLKMSKPVQLLKSIHVDVPMTYGVWKPVILIPAGLFFQLSPLQLEAIIAHELAHIKRYDFLVNLVQSILEVVFFFHPIFWWVNKTAKEQRENACDDLAISMGASPKDLAYGLANVLNHAKNPTPEMVMAAAKTKNPTLERIKRIMGVKTSSSQPTTITSMTMMITLLLGATLMVGASDKPSKESFEDLMATELNTTTIEGNWIDPYSYPKEDTVPPKSPVKMDLDWDKMTPEQKETFGKDMEEGLKDLGEFFKDMTPVFEGIGEIGSLFRDFPGTPIPPMDFAIAGIPEFELKDIPMMDFDIAPFITFPDSAWYFEVPSDIYFPADSASVYNFSYRNKYYFDTTKMSKAEIDKKRAIMAEESAKRAEAIEKWNSENKDRIAEWQKKVEAWQKEMAPKAEEFQAKMEEWQKANAPRMEEFQNKMKAWQEENQPRLEEFEKKMEEWQKANEPRMKEFEQRMEAWQKENQPKIEEFQKKMEIWQQENQEKMKEFQMKMQEWQKENQEKMQQLEKSQKEKSKKEID